MSETTPEPIELKNIEIWSQPNCMPCDMLKSILDNILKVPYTVKMIQDEINKEDFYKKFPGARTVPQIIIDGNHIGGFPEFQRMMRDGNLKQINVV